MFFKFSKSLFDNLLLNGFHILTGEAVKGVYNDDTQMVALEKFSGSNLYIVFIQNTVNHKIDTLIPELIKVNDYLWHLPQIKQYKQVVILNILPCYNCTDDISIDNLLQTPSNIPDSLIYNVFWKVDINTNQITVGKNQPSKILGIEKLVADAVQKSKLDTAPVSNNCSILETYKTTITSYISKNNIMLAKPYLTVGLILLMFGLVIYSEFIDTRVLFDLNVNANDVLKNKQYYRLITAIFMHANIIHFLSNALGIFIFGARIERVYGYTNMFFTFLLSAIIGNIFTVILLPMSYSVGASGGVAGLMGFALGITLLRPNMLLGLDFNTVAIMSVVLILSTLTLAQINNVAHISGFVIGLIISVFLALTTERETI